MRIKVSSLVRGENTLQFVSHRDPWLEALRKEYAGDGLTLGDEISCQVAITNLDPEFYIRGEVRGVLQGPCSRCAEDCKVPVRADFEFVFSRKQGEQPNGKGENEEQFIAFSGDEIDAHEAIREELLLAIPFHVTCAADCKGICQKCGKNLTKETCSCMPEVGASPFSALKDLLEAEPSGRR